MNICIYVYIYNLSSFLQGWHKFDPATQEHQSDLDWSKISFSEEQVEFQTKIIPYSITLNPYSFTAQVRRLIRPELNCTTVD